MADKIEYTYPVEELDKMISLFQSGAKPMVPDRMKIEIDLRYQELLQETGYGDDESFEALQEVHDSVQKAIEEKRRKATRKTAEFRQLPQKIMDALEEGMEVSIVRNIPNSNYNKTDEELYADAEERSIMQSLSRIRNAYFDPISFKAAYDTIRRAIFFSITHDYPWMTTEEAVSEFNKGKIKYQGIVPKLYLGFGVKEVTDPEILIGIINGEVVVKDRNDEDEDRFKDKANQKYTPVSMDYSVVGDTEYAEDVKLHNRGYDTPLSTVLKSKSGMFDRLSLPFNFAGTAFNQPGATSKRDEALLAFDWFKPDAAEKYFALKYGKPYGTTDQFLDQVFKENGGLGSTIMQNMPEFIRSLNTATYSAVPYQSMARQNEELMKTAASIEQNILNTIRSMNPTLMQQQK